MEAPQQSPNETRPAHGPIETDKSWLDDIRIGLIAYYLTSAIAVGAVVFGSEWLHPADHPLARADLPRSGFANWDGMWFAKIACKGYHYDPERASGIAFFPAYPVLGRWLADLTGLDVETSLLIVAHL